MSRSALAVSCLALALPITLPAEAKTPAKQIVIISFDGAGDNALWEKSRSMAKTSGAHFTYFLSCTNLIPKENASSYKAPGMRAGRSNVGFAPDVADVRRRLDEIWKAHQEGHEIASHGCGHFDGKEWSKNDWLEDMTSFNTVIQNAWKTSGIAEKEPKGWQEFTRADIRGFRAPYLSTSESLHAAEQDAGYVFDASMVTNGPAMPKSEGGVTAFGLPLIPEGPKQRNIIAMDYNLYFRHSGAKEDPAHAAEFEKRAYDAFRAAFDRQYAGARIPLQLGFHFVEMNDGAYWRALERINKDVCTKDDVECVTYSEAMAKLGLDQNDPERAGQ